MPPFFFLSTIINQVKCVEKSIKSCHQLQQDIGSYALMASTGFENIDFLTCCKFAEGDSRILQQKMSRDRMKLFTQNKSCPEGVDKQDWTIENEACVELATKMETIMQSSSGEGGVMMDKLEAWDHCWEDVYALSEIIMTRTMKSFMANKSNE